MIGPDWETSDTRKAPVVIHCHSGTAQCTASIEICDVLPCPKGQNLHYKGTVVYLCITVSQSTTCKSGRVHTETRSTWGCSCERWEWVIAKTGTLNTRTEHVQRWLLDQNVHFPSPQAKVEVH